MTRYINRKKLQKIVFQFKNYRSGRQMFGAVYHRNARFESHLCHLCTFFFFFNLWKAHFTEEFFPPLVHFPDGSSAQSWADPGATLGLPRVCRGPRTWSGLLRFRRPASEGQTLGSGHQRVDHSWNSLLYKWVVDNESSFSFFFFNLEMCY